MHFCTGALGFLGHALPAPVNRAQPARLQWVPRDQEDVAGEVVACTPGQGGTCHCSSGAPLPPAHAVGQHASPIIWLGAATAELGQDGIGKQTPHHMVCRLAVVMKHVCVPLCLIPTG